jgi:hypothetical protein
MSMEVSAVQLRKATSSIEVREEGVAKVMEVRDEHPEKAIRPIEVTELGMVIDASEAQSLKVPSPIEVTEAGMVIDASEAQPLKA